MAIAFLVADYSGDTSLASQAGSAVDATFCGRVGVAATHNAILIQGEDPATTFHTKRAALAFAMLVNPSGYHQAIAWAVVADGSTGPSSTDLAILGRVATVWDAVAGVGS